MREATGQTLFSAAASAIRTCTLCATTGEFDGPDHRHGASVAHGLAPYIKLLDIDGSVAIVEAIDMLCAFHSGVLLGGRKRVPGSPIGDVRGIQELLDLCAEKASMPIARPSPCTTSRLLMRAWKNLL